MGPFSANYAAGFAAHLPVSLADVRKERELLVRTGLQYVINDPELQAGWEKSPPGILATDLIWDLGTRLKKALGEDPVFDRNGYLNAPFSVPYYHSYVEGLDRAMWTAVSTYRAPQGYAYGSSLHIVGYSNTFDAWGKYHGRSGFMCSLLSPYEYCYTFWDQELNGDPPMKHYVPDLFDDGTFGVWLGVLPQPVSLILEGRNARLRWAATEPRVLRSEEMGRYTLPDEERSVEVRGFHWRHARALALVSALEKMAANEPTDRYKSVMLAEEAAKREKEKA